MLQNPIGLWENRDTWDEAVATYTKTVRARDPSIRAVVLDCGAIHDVDLMACEMLAELDRELETRGVRLAFGDLRDRVKRDILRGLELGPHMADPTFSTVEDAARAMVAT